MKNADLLKLDFKKVLAIALIKLATVAAVAGGLTGGPTATSTPEELERNVCGSLGMVQLTIEDTTFDVARACFQAGAYRSIVQSLSGDSRNFAWLEEHEKMSEKLQDVCTSPSNSKSKNLKSLEDKVVALACIGA